MSAAVISRPARSGPVVRAATCPGSHREADRDAPETERVLDRAGVALVSNSISGPHQTYLADGGLGFILGDGGLSAGRENIAEGFYTAYAWRGVFVAADLQYIAHPGYNRVRGPVTVPGLRLHLEF